VYDPKAQCFEEEYSYDWFVSADEYDAITEPELVFTGSKWEAALAEARKSNKHPKGVCNLKLGKCRDSEGTLIAYLKFDTAGHFRQWLLTDGKCPFEASAGLGPAGSWPGWAQARRGPLGKRGAADCVYSAGDDAAISRI
jgi:hypothetical protein